MKGDRADAPRTQLGDPSPRLNRLISGRFVVPGDLRGDANVFTIVRCGLALAVIFTHAYGVTGAGHDPSTAVLPFPVSRLAVLLFFTLSGFMVTGSFMRRGLGSFVAARGLRILPGLWVMLLLSTLVLGLFFGALPANEYFTFDNLAGYLGRNAALIGGGNYQLGGVFTANPTHEVNRSLWSIPLEVRCYLTVIVLGLIGVLARRRLFLAGYVMLVAASFVPAAQAIAFVPLAVSFYAGVAMYLWRDRLYLSWPLAIAVMLAGVVMPPGFAAQVVVQLGFGYGAVVAAILLPAGWKRIGARMPDYSYGIYIYAAPVQQAMVAATITTTPLANIGASLLVIVPLAALSWHFVEHPALDLKSRVIRRRDRAGLVPT